MKTTTDQTTIPACTLTDYRAKGGNPDSPENQAIVRALVAREVICCFSQGFSEILNAHNCHGAFSEWEEDLHDLCRLAPDYEEEGREQGWRPLAGLTGEEAKAAAEEETGDELVEGEDPHPYLESEFYQFHRGHCVATSDAGGWEELAEEQDFADDARDNAGEVYEHWIVTDWAARKLAENGGTTGEVVGLTLWGRGCTGQAVYLDHVWQNLAAGMGILAGQENEWKDCR